MALLSFIIPVFNVELYLSECIDSILSQLEEKDDCEILLIDDGSTDTSGKICDAYTLKDERIKVVHKKNEGVSVARNVGISIATGKYLAFVDSDDRITENSLQRILTWAKASDAEICFLQTIKFFSNGDKEDLGDKIFEDDIKNRSAIEILDFLSKRPKYPGSACSKLFLRNFIKDKGFSFPLGRKHGEDLTFCRDCFYASEKYSCLNVSYYEYRQNRQGSATNIVSQKMFSDIFLFIEDSVEMFCTRKQAKNEKAEKLMSFIAYEYAILLWRLNYFKGKEYYGLAYKSLKEYKWVLRYGRSKKVKIIYWILSVLGMKLTSKIISLIKK